MSSGSFDEEAGMCLDESGGGSGQGVSVQSSDLTDRGGEIREHTEDMGQVHDLGGGFCQNAGNLVDFLVPNEGDKGKLQVNVNVPVDQSGTVRISFEFIAEVERDEHGVKGRIQVGGGVTAQTHIDAYFFTVDAFARAMVFGYVESYGENGTQMFQLMSLGLQQRVNSVSSRVADAVWDRDYIDSTIQNMDDDDYVESGLGAELTAGVSAHAGDEGGGAGAGVGASTGTRLSSNGHGGLNQTSVSQVSGQLQGEADPFGLDGKLTGKWEEGQFHALEGELSGQAMMDAGDLSEVIVGGRWLSGMISNLASIIGGGAGLLDDQNAARRVGGLAAFIHRSSGIGVMAEAASSRAISQLEGMGVKLGHKLSVKGTWEEGKGFGLEINLERVSQIEFGENPRAMVYVLVENVQRVFRIHAGA